MLMTHRAGKGPGGCGGWGLGSRNRRGPGVPSASGLRGQGTSPGSPAGFLGSSGRDKCPPLLSCSSGLGGPLPPSSLDLPRLPLMPPRTHAAWRWLWRAGDQPGSSAGSLGWSGWDNHPPLLSHSSWRVPPACLSWSPLPPSYAPSTYVARIGLWGVGVPAWELSRLPSLSGPGDHPLPLSRPSQRVPPTCLSWSPWPWGADPVWPPFLLPLSPPMPYRFTLGFLPSPWALESPTSGWQAP